MSENAKENHKKALEKKLTTAAKAELKRIWPEVAERYDPRDEATWFTYLETYAIVQDVFKNRVALFGKKKQPSVKDLFVFENLASAHKNNLAKCAYALKLTPRSREGADKTSAKTGRNPEGLRDRLLRRGD